MKTILTKVSYMAIGSLLTLIGYHFGNIDNNSANAQENLEFNNATVYKKPVVPIVDEIRCRSLVVVGKDDTPRIILSTSFSDRGAINIYNEDGAGRIFLGVSSYYDSGGLEISGKDAGDAATMLGMDDYGGFMALFNKTLDKPVIQSSITDRGEGLIFTRDESGNHIDTVGQRGHNRFKEKFRN